MIELVHLYSDLNKRSLNFKKVPINIVSYSKTVKLSVIAVEFRDKLLQRKQCPMLLGHSSQGHVKMSNKAMMTEISKYIGLLNSERTSTMKLLSREFKHDLAMEKRINEITALNK